MVMHICLPAWSNDAAIQLAGGHAFSRAFSFESGRLICCLQLFLTVLGQIRLTGPDLAGQCIAFTSSISASVSLPGLLGLDHDALLVVIRELGSAALSNQVALHVVNKTGRLY